MKEYEDASIIAVTDVLHFSSCIGGTGKLSEGISMFKQALVSYGLDHCSQNFQTMLLSVDALIGIMQETVFTRSVFGMNII